MLTAVTSDLLKGENITKVNNQSLLSIQMMDSCGILIIFHQTMKVNQLKYHLCIPVTTFLHFLRPNILFRYNIACPDKGCYIARVILNITPTTNQNTKLGSIDDPKFQKVVPNTAKLIYSCMG